MRFNGKLEKWNDDRGFGFITPVGGGEPVFVHVSAFPRDGLRPQLGEILTFEVEPARDGKKRAINVKRPGSHPPPHVQARSHEPQRGYPRRSPAPRRDKPRSRIGGLLTALVLLGVGGYAYTQFNVQYSGGGEPAASAPSTVAETPATAAYRCDGRTHCSQMTSCEEAKFFLRNCPGTQMDGNGDGVPCERQWCTGPFAR